MVGNFYKCESIPMILKFYGRPIKNTFSMISTSSGIRAQKVFCDCVFIFYRLKRENLDIERLGQERKEEKGLRKGIKDKRKKVKETFLKMDLFMKFMHGNFKGKGPKKKKEEKKKRQEDIEILGKKAKKNTKKLEAILIILKQKLQMVREMKKLIF